MSLEIVWVEDKKQRLQLYYQMECCGFEIYPFGSWYLYTFDALTACGDHVKSNRGP